MPAVSPRALGVVVVTAALLLAGCGADRQVDALDALRSEQRAGGHAGLQLTGTVAGRHLSVADRTPELFEGDCDPMDGSDRDVCFISRDLTGELVVFVLENPALLAAGERLPVGDPPCATPAECDEVTDAAIVDLQIGTDPRRRAVGGTLTIAVVEPGQRYAGTVSLRFRDGRVTGSFDVIPRPD